VGLAAQETGERLTVADTPAARARIETVFMLDEVWLLLENRSITRSDRLGGCDGYLGGTGALK
jgi:hypothetical protein